MNRREFLAGSVCVGSVAAAAGLASAATDGKAASGANTVHDYCVADCQKFHRTVLQAFLYGEG